MILSRSYLPECTIGRLASKSGEIICYTVERPWHNNEPFISCVPEGEYNVTKHASPKFGETLIVLNQERGVGFSKNGSDRYGILFHVANVASELQGCIAPGLEIRNLRIKDYYELGVGQSKKAMERLLKMWEPRLLIQTYTPANMKDF